MAASADPILQYPIAEKRTVMFTRALSLITLIAFVPLATGCSTVRSLPIPDDPGGEGDPLRAEEPLAITGYTDVRGTDHDWNGFVQAAGADSLEFTGPVRFEGDVHLTGESGQPSLRLARGEVTRVEIRQPHAGWTRLLAGIVALGMIAVVVMVVIDDPSGGVEVYGR